MKVNNVVFVVLSILIALACNNQQNKDAGENNSVDKNHTPRDTTILKSDYPEKKSHSPCESIVSEILTTSPRYKQLTKGLLNGVIKNGGQSIGVSLEGSPNPKQDNAWGYSKTYDYCLYEMYPERKLNTARFSFDPYAKKLYEHDEIQDTLTSIEYDENLLVKFETLCE